MKKEDLGKIVNKMYEKWRVLNRTWRYLDPMKDYTKEEIKEEYKKAYKKMKEKGELL